MKLRSRVGGRKKGKRERGREGREAAREREKLYVYVGVRGGERQDVRESVGVSGQGEWRRKKEN